MLTIGGVGHLSCVANVAPKPCAALYDAFVAGDFDEALRLHYELHPLVDMAFLETNPGPVKWAMEQIGVLGLRGRATAAGDALGAEPREDPRASGHDRTAGARGSAGVSLAAAGSAPSAGDVHVGAQLHYIDGEFRPGRAGGTFETLSPVTNLPIASVAEGLALDVDDAVRAARHAFDEGPWPRLAVKERAAVLRRVATAIRDNAADFIGLECLDIGLPIAQMRGLAARAAENFDFFAAGIEELTGQAYRVGDDAAPGPTL